MEGDDEEYKVEIRHILCDDSDGAIVSMLKLPESTPSAQKLLGLREAAGLDPAWNDGEQVKYLA